MSLSPLEIPSEPGLFGEPFEAEPVRVPVAEAAQALDMLLAELSGGRPPGRSPAPAPPARVRRARLVYLPFHRRRTEWVEELTGTALPAAAVEHGSRL
ncbi:MAG: hypothetical protein ACNA8S_02265 [Deferrisomatales bacterium]